MEDIKNTMRTIITEKMLLNQKNETTHNNAYNAPSEMTGLPAPFAYLNILFILVLPTSMFLIDYFVRWKNDPTIISSKLLYFEIAKYALIVIFVLLLLGLCNLYGFNNIWIFIGSSFSFFGLMVGNLMFADSLFYYGRTLFLN